MHHRVLLQFHSNRSTRHAPIGKYEEWSPAATVVTTGGNVLIALLIQLAALDGRVVTVKPNFSSGPPNNGTFDCRAGDEPQLESTAVDGELRVDSHTRCGSGLQGSPGPRRCGSSPGQSTRPGWMHQSDCGQSGGQRRLLEGRGGLYISRKMRVLIQGKATGQACQRGPGRCGQVRAAWWQALGSEQGPSRP